MSGNENRSTTENRIRYEGCLRDHRPHASEQLKTAFLRQTEGYYLGAHEMLTAFDWFWKGWAASSGARAQRAEVGTLDMSLAARLKDAESDVLRLHGEKMKFFERTIELEREVEKKQAMLTHLGELLQQQTYTAAVIKILSDEALERTGGPHG